MSIDPPIIVPHAFCFVPRGRRIHLSYNKPIHASSVGCGCSCTSVLSLLVYIYYHIDTPSNLVCPFFVVPKISCEVHFLQQRQPAFLQTRHHQTRLSTPGYITCPDQRRLATTQSHSLAWCTRRMMANCLPSYANPPDTFAYPQLPAQTLTIRRNHRAHARALRGVDFDRPVAGPSRPRHMEARKRRTGNNMDRPTSPKKPRTTEIDESPGSSQSEREQDHHISTQQQHHHHHPRHAAVPADTTGPAESAHRVRAETSRAAHAHHRELTGDSPDVDTSLDRTCPNQRSRSFAPSVDGYDSGSGTPARPQCVWKRRSRVDGLSGWPRAVGLWRRSLTTHTRGGSLKIFPWQSP